MPRKKLIRTNEYAYHVTTRVNNKDWFYIHLSECWRLLSTFLIKGVEKYKVEIHAVVLLSNHLHTIFTTPNSNIDRFMQFVLSGFAAEVQKRSKRINHIFGTRYRWTLLPNPIALAYAYKYLYRNPVRAGICESVQDYPYSSLNSSLVPIVEGITDYWDYIPRNFQERLEWLNIPTPKEQEELIEKALKHQTFNFSSRSNDRHKLKSLQKNYQIEKVSKGVRRLLIPQQPIRDAEGGAVGGGDVSERVGA